MRLNFGKSPQMLPNQPVSTQFLSHPLLQEKGVDLAVLRLDLIHPEVSGNKFFKLKYNLEQAKKEQKSTILTFGGAFSNHIYATAAACHAEGLRSIGVIRGEISENLNPTLQYSKDKGMEFYFLDREEYRRKTEPRILHQLEARFGDFYLVPEGGTNELAIQGTAEILSLSRSDFSHISTPIGTGGTFAGLCKSLLRNQTLLGFSSLKGGFIHQEIGQLLLANNIHSDGQFEIFTEFHFGGYAKWKPELLEFLNWFFDQFGIVLDPVYTGKMAFGLWDLIEKGFFPKDSRILMIHTGGLQGNLGFIQQTGRKIPSPSA